MVSEGSHKALSTHLCGDQVRIYTTARGVSALFIQDRTASGGRAHAYMKLLMYNYSTSF